MAFSQNQYGGGGGVTSPSDLSAWYATQGRGTLGAPGSNDYATAQKMYWKAHAQPKAPTTSGSSMGDSTFTVGGGPTQMGGTYGQPSGGNVYTGGSSTFNENGGTYGAPSGGGAPNPFSVSPMGGGAGYNVPVKGGGYPSQGSLPAPYALGNTPGADVGYQNLTNQLSGMNNPMLSGANAVMNTAFDPQGALYDRTLQQVQDQQRVGQAARGITMSPYGAGLENKALSDFNIDWQNNQLGRQTQGLGAAQQAYGQSAQNTQSSIQDWLNYINQAQSGYGNQVGFYNATKPQPPAGQTGTTNSYYNPYPPGFGAMAAMGNTGAQSDFNNMMNQYKQLYPG